MRVIVCGGRDYQDHEKLNERMDTLHHVHHFETVIQGGAAGADYFAKRWAMKHGIHCVEYKANWRQYGKVAGRFRNQEMLDDGKPDMVIAFEGGTGTADMVRRAKDSGLDVIDFNDGHNTRLTYLEKMDV